MKKMVVMLSLLISVHVFPQENIAPPSTHSTELLSNNPDIADLGKFGSIPVNQYNGTANISVPIYKLDFERLSIPITAHYNTSGVRVAQEASWVGLGWSLNEGYAITREINGFEDLNSGVENSNKGWIYTNQYLEFSTSESYQNSPYVIAPENLVQLSNVFSSRPHDTEPDLFTVSLPNSSVSFYLPKIEGNETILTANVVNQKNYKVIYDIATQNFEVTDSSGFQYFFNVKERSTGFTNSDAPNVANETAAIGGVPSYSIRQSTQVILTWKLSKIISPLGKELRFSFEDGFHCSYPQFTEKSAIPIHNQLFDFATQGEILSPTLSVSLTLFQNKYLKRIEGDFGSIEFINSDREDLFSRESFRLLPGVMGWNPLSDFATNIKKLDAVLIRDYNNTVSQRADFSYSYFNEDERNSNISIAEKQKYIRLKLDGIHVNDKQYRFEYISPNELAPKDSKSTDFWGFYNGIANTSRIPSLNRFYVANAIAINQHPRWVFYKGIGANKKSDINYGKIGLLKKVIYPTNGSTEFVYEANTVSLKKPFYTHSISYDPVINTNIISSTSLESSESYNFRYQYLKLANDPSYSFYNSITDSGDNFPTIYEEFEVGGARIHQLINKEYNDDILTISQYEYDQIQPNGSSLSSGKLMDDLVYTSSGRGNYEYTPEIFGQESGAYASPNGNYVHSNNLLRTKNSASGSHVGYSQVAHKKIGINNMNLGKTVSLFNNDENEYVKRNIMNAITPFANYCNNIGVHTVEYYQYVYDGSILECHPDRRVLPNQEVYILGGATFSHDNSNGSLMNSIVYDQTNHIVQESINEYQTYSLPMPFYSYPKLFYYGINNSFNINQLFEPVLSNSLTSNEVHKLKKSIQKNIFDGNEVVDTTEYFYSNSHMLLEKTIQTNSQNEKIISEIYYPQDIDSNEPFIDELIAQNRFTTPIIQENLKEIGNQRKRISKSKTIYGSFENDQILPFKIQTAKGDETLEDQFIYHKYDSKGNPIVMSKKDGTKVCYIWGYHQTQPIIKIEGFSSLSHSQQIAITNAVNASNYDIDQTSEDHLRSKLELVRTTFSNSIALLTTLTYNPQIGITSITDPRGKTMYYHYDAFNRLQFVKDHEGNIVSKNEYNFKN